MLSRIFRALRLGGVLTSPQAAPSGLQMTPPSHSGTENPRKPASPDFILIRLSVEPQWFEKGIKEAIYKLHPIWTNIIKERLTENGARTTTGGKGGGGEEGMERGGSLQIFDSVPVHL